MPTPDAPPDESPEQTPDQTPVSRNTPVVMETPDKTPRLRATPDEFTRETPLPPQKTPRPTPTPKPTKLAKATDEPVEMDLSMETPDATPLPEVTAALPEPTPDEPVVATTAETRVASLTFVPGPDVSLVKIDATTTGGQSIVKIQLSGNAAYKILPLPNRRQIWVDFEALGLSEPKTITGSGASLVKDISAKAFERGLVRVVVQLKDDGKPFPVIGPKKRTGEAANVEVKIGPDPDPPL